MNRSSVIQTLFGIAYRHITVFRALLCKPFNFIVLTCKRLYNPVRTQIFIYITIDIGELITQHSVKHPCRTIKNKSKNNYNRKKYKQHQRDNPAVCSKNHKGEHKHGTVTNKCIEYISEKIMYHIHIGRELRNKLAACILSIKRKIKRLKLGIQL